MKHTVKILALTVACGVLQSLPAQTTLLTYYNFNNTSPSPIVSGQIASFATTGSAEIYNSTSTTISIGSAGVKASSSVLNLSSLNSGGTWGAYFGNTLNSYGGAPAGGALQVVGSALNSEKIVLSLNTVGYQDLSVSFVTASNASGATGILWEVSSDGVNYVSAGSTSNLPRTNAFTLNTVNLSAFNQIENISTAYIRFSFTGITGNGTTRFDNFQINAVAVPEPATAAMLIGGLCLFCCYLRHRRRKGYSQ